MRSVIRLHLLYFRRLPSSNFKIVGDNTRARLQLLLQLGLQHVVGARIEIKDHDIGGLQIDVQQASLGDLDQILQIEAS